MVHAWSLEEMPGLLSVEDLESMDVGGTRIECRTG